MKESPIHFKFINQEGIGTDYYHAVDAKWQLGQKSGPIISMLSQVFPDLSQWFNYSALEQVNEDSVAILAQNDQEEVLGFAHARQESLINGQEGIDKWVFSILAAKAQGHGIGSKLVNHLKMEVKRYGGKYLFARTDPTRRKTIAFYQKNGFQKDGKIGHYYYGPSPALWLWSDLDDIEVTNNEGLPTQKSNLPAYAGDARYIPYSPETRKGKWVVDPNYHGCRGPSYKFVPDKD
jgi:ribosomal protein S18 acetylase RimI-like enzyme